MEQPLVTMGLECGSGSLMLAIDEKKRSTEVHSAKIRLESLLHVNDWHSLSPIQCFKSKLIQLVGPALMEAEKLGSLRHSSR